MPRNDLVEVLICLDVIDRASLVLPLGFTDGGLEDTCLLRGVLVLV